MNTLAKDIEPFNYELDLNDEMHKTGEKCSCVQCQNNKARGSITRSLQELLELDNFYDDEFEDEVDFVTDSELEIEQERKRRIRRRPSRSTRRTLSRTKQIPRPKPRRPGKVLRPKFLPRRKKFGRKPLRTRRRRPVVIREPAAPCVCPTLGTEFVRWVQTSLNQIMKIRLRVNGVMNRATRNALRDFQKQEGLPIDGIAGPETEKALINAKADRSGGTSNESEYLEFDFTNLEFEEVNRKSRDYVRWIQRSLNKILKLRLSIDGIIGRNTRNAVRSFQRSHGLVADGIVGSRTEKTLIAMGADYPHSNQPSSGFVPQVSINSFLVGGVPQTPSMGLNITNYIDPSVQRFRNQTRSSTSVNELIVHETVTRSVRDTVKVLNERGLGVHLIMGPNGEITQHGDLLDDLLWHASQHNPMSVGIEVVNPYYPKYLKAGMPWTKVINAGWAHKGRYVVPTPKQAEAVARLIFWITSSKVKGLSIPRKWIGLSGNRLAMEQVSGANRRNPGVYAHTYFNHADGSWLILYAYLRINKGRTQDQAYNEAIRLATTSNRFVTLP